MAGAGDLPSGHIAKYEILGLVGEGAMGNVYRARDPVLNRTVAVKVMSDAIARDGELRDRFMREAQAAGSLQHPNVVTIYDFGEVDGHLFIAMEFVAGVDLEIIIGERRPLPLPVRLGIIVDVLVGLSYAHRHGVVHRDIKPANIRVTEDSRAKIMDFGIAHLDDAKMTRTGIMMGTPNYMAPEQVTGGRISPSTDIFSVGAVLYEFLTGNKAFTAESLHSVLYKVVTDDPPPLAQVAPHLPSELTRILQRALAKASEERYQDAMEMANDLNAVLTRLDDAAENPAPLSLSATLTHFARSEALVAPEPELPLVPGPVATVPATTAPHEASVRRNRPVAYAVLGAGALVAAAIAWSTRDSAPVFPAPSVSVTAAPVATDLPQAGKATAVAPSGVGSNAPAPPETPAPAASREADLVQLVRSTAIAQRRRAEQSGATAAQLERGDAHLRRGDQLHAGGRYPDAVQAMNAASAVWREVERSVAVARSGVSPDTAIAPPPSPAPVVVPAVVSPPASTQGATAPASAPPRRVPDVVAEVTPGVAAETQIAQLVTEYARAIESRDVSRIREVYPAITGEQSQRFTQFFRAVRSLRATLAGARPEVTGVTATSRVSGTYEFIDPSGNNQRQPVTFLASFRREGDQWHLTGVR